MPVKLIKLTNGETILTDVLDVTEQIVTIINPLEIKTESRARGKSMMVAHQWLPMFDEENIMYVQSAHIVAIANASVEMQEYYVEALDRILFPEKEQKRMEEEQEYIQEMLSAMANTNTKMYH